MTKPKPQPSTGWWETLVRPLRARQRVAELSLLNEVSRAIISAELDVDALCELVYHEASQVMDTSWFHLGLFEGEEYALKVKVENGERLSADVYDLSENAGLMGWMRQTGRTLLVEDFEQELPHLPAQPRYQASNPPRSGMYVPLLAGDAVIGTISVQSATPRRFGENDLRFLSLIADAAASAIAKARAYASLEERINQLQLIGEVGRQVTAILDLDQLLPSVAHLIRDAFGYFAVHVFVLDPDGQHLIFRASTAADQSVWRGRFERIPLGRGIVGTVAQTGETLLANDVRNEPRFILDLPGTRAELAVPVRSGERLLAVLDVQSDRVGAFTPNDRFVLQTLAAQLAPAVDAAQLYTQQQQEAWALAALLQSAENIARSSSLDDLLATMVRLPALLVGCDRVSVLRYARELDAFVPVATWGWSAEARTALLGHPLPVAQVPLLDTTRRTATPQTIANIRRVPAAVGALAAHCGSGRLLALPLLARGVVLGVLLLDADDVQTPWTAQQITIGAGLASQAASAMESALLALAAMEQERLTQEVRVAREIQTSLLPDAPPALPGWDVAAAWQSARAVGGDFYDFWDLPGGRFGFVIADVSDKGVPAALFMALSRSLMRAAALDGSTPYQAVERANRWITRDSQSGMFVTLFYGVLLPETGELTYTNAGHNPPLLMRTDGTHQPLTTSGIALGVIEDAKLGELHATVEMGDVLVCYTDGVTEAIDTHENEYGVARLTALVQRLQHQTAKEMVAAILADLEEHTEHLPAFDDVTLMVLKRVGGGAIRPASA